MAAYVAPTLIDGQPVPAATWNEALSTLQAVAGAATDTWKTVPLSNGWTGTLRVRLIAPNVVLAQGTLTAGTKANGTIVGVLPAGYRPLVSCDLFASCDLTVAGGQSPHFNAVANGNFTCWGLSAAGSAGVATLYATDI